MIKLPITDIEQEAKQYTPSAWRKYKLAVIPIVNQSVN